MNKLFESRKNKCELAIKRGFSYDENTGIIKTPTGKTASKVAVNGYIMLTVRNKNQKAFYLYGHQFAWYFKNRECVDVLDHIDGLKTNNKIDNLRVATHRLNAYNRKGVTGVCFDKRNGKWIASITLNYKNKFLGYYDTREEAQLIYENYKKQLLKQEYGILSNR